MGDIIFNISADSATSLTRICRVVGMVFAVEGIGIEVEIVGIGRF